MPALQIYTLSMLYYVDVFSAFFETYPECTKITLVPRPVILDEASRTLSLETLVVAQDTVRHVAKKYGVTVDIQEGIATTEKKRLHWKTLTFDLLRRMFGWGLSVFNTFITAAQPRKKIRILATDYWKHLSPFMAEMPEAELVLIDRAEVFKAGIASIWKHRMRFMHADNFVSTAMRKRSSTMAYEFLAQWSAHRDANQALARAEYSGIKLAELLEPNIKIILKRGGERAATMIDGVYAMFDRIQPDIVLVRASFRSRYISRFSVTSPANSVYRLSKYSTGSCIWGQGRSLIISLLPNTSRRTDP